MIRNAIISGNDFADIYILYSGTIISLLSFRQVESKRLKKKYGGIDDVFALFVGVYVRWSQLLWCSAIQTGITL